MATTTNFSDYLISNWSGKTLDTVINTVGDASIIAAVDGQQYFSISSFYNYGNKIENTNVNSLNQDPKTITGCDDYILFLSDIRADYSIQYITQNWFISDGTGGGYWNNGNPIESTIYVLTPFEASSSTAALYSSNVVTVNELDSSFSGNIKSSTIKNDYYKSTNDGNTIKVSKLFSPVSSEEETSTGVKIINEAGIIAHANDVNLYTDLNAFNSAITPWDNSDVSGYIYIPFYVRTYTVGKAYPESLIVDGADTAIYSLTLNNTDSDNICIIKFKFNQACWKPSKYPITSFSVTPSNSSSFNNIVNLPAYSEEHTDTLYAKVTDWPTSDPSVQSMLKYCITTPKTQTQPKRYAISTKESPSGNTALITPTIVQTLPNYINGYGFTQKDSINETALDSSLTVKWPSNTSTVQSIDLGYTDNLLGFYYIPSLANSDTYYDTYANAPGTKTFRSFGDVSICLKKDDEENKNKLYFSVSPAQSGTYFSPSSFSTTNWYGYQNTVSTTLSGNLSNFIVVISEISDSNTTYINAYNGSSGNFYSSNDTVKTLYNGMKLDVSVNGGSVGSSIYTTSNPRIGSLVTSSASSNTTYSITVTLPRSYSNWNKDLTIKVLTFEATSANEIPETDDVSALYTLTLKSNYDQFSLSNSSKENTKTYSEISPSNTTKCSTSSTDTTIYSSYQYKFTTIPTNCAVYINGGSVSSSSLIEPASGGRSVYFEIPPKPAGVTSQKFVATAYDYNSNAISSKTLTFTLNYADTVLNFLNGTSTVSTEGGNASYTVVGNCVYTVKLTRNGTDITNSTTYKLTVDTTNSVYNTKFLADPDSGTSITYYIPKNTDTDSQVNYVLTLTASDGTTISRTITQGATAKINTFTVSCARPSGGTPYPIANGDTISAASNTAYESILGYIINTGNVADTFSLVPAPSSGNDCMYFVSNQYSNTNIGSSITINAGVTQWFRYNIGANDSTDSRIINYTINSIAAGSIMFRVQQGGGSKEIKLNEDGNYVVSFKESGNTSPYSFTITNNGTVSAKYKIYTSNEYCKLSLNSGGSTKSTTIVLDSSTAAGSTTNARIYAFFDKNTSTSNRECYITVEDTLQSSQINKRTLMTQMGWPDPTIALTCYNKNKDVISSGQIIQDAKSYTWAESGGNTSSATPSSTLYFTITWPSDLNIYDTSIKQEIGCDVTIDYNTVASIAGELSTYYSSFSVNNNTNSTQENIPIYVRVKSYYKNIRGSFTPTAPYTQTFVYYLKANAIVSIGGEYSGNYLRNIDGIGNCYVFGPGYGAPGYGIRDFTVYDANNGNCKWEAILSTVDQEKINAYLTPSSNTITSSAYINALDKFTSSTTATLKIKATNLITENIDQKSVKFYKYPKPSLTGVFESNSKSTIDLSASDFKSDDTYNEYLDRYFYVDYDQNIVSQYEIQGDENIVVNKVYDDSNHIDTDTRRWYKVRISKNVNTNKALVSTIRFSYNYNDSIPDHTDDLTFDFIITVNPAPDPVVKVNKTLYNYEYYAGYQEGRYNLAESVTIDTTSNYLPVKWEFSDEELGTSGNEFNVTADGNILNVTIPVNTSTQNNKICKVALKYYYMGTTDHSYDKTEYLTFTVNKAEAPTFEVTGWKNELSYNFNSSLDDASVKIGINTSDTNHLPVSWSYDITERGTSGHEFDFFKQSDSVGYLTVPDNPNKISKSCTVLFSYKYTGNTSETFTSSYTCKVNSASPISFIVNAKSQDSNGNDVSVMSLDNSVEYYFGKNNSIAISVNTSNNSLPISWNYVKEESGTNGNEFIVQKDANNSSAGITILNVAVPTNTSIISYKSCLITFNYKYADAEAAGDSETVLFRINVGKATKPVISIYPAEVSWPGNHSTGDIQDITVSIANAELETVWEYEVIESGTDGNEFTLIKNESDNKLRISSIPLNASPEVDKKCNIKFKCYYAGSTDHVNDNTAAGVYTVKYVIGSQLSYDRNELVTQESIQCSQDGSTYTLSVYGMIDTTGERTTPAYIQIGSEYITYGSKNIGKFKQTTVYPSSGMTADTYNQFDIEFEMYDSVELNDVTDVIYIKPYDANGNVGNTCTLSITQSAKNIYKPTVTTSKVSATGNISGNDYNLGFSTYVTSNYSHSNNDNIITYTDYCKILDYGIMIKQQDRNVWTTLWNSTYKDNLIYTEQLRTSTKTTIYYSMSLPYTNSILKISPDKTYEYKAVAKATYRDGKSNESEWVTETVSGSVNTFMIHGYKEEDLEYIRPYFKPVEKVNGYTTGVEIKNFLNSKAISFNRKKAKTIDISNWYSNYSISGNTLFLDINNALIDLVLHTPAFNKAWDYIKDDNLTDFKKLYIKKNIIPNIIINDKCIVELYCDETSSALGLTSEYNENMVKIKNFKNSLIRSAESDTYKMSITLDKNKQYYVVLRLNF